MLPKLLDVPISTYLIVFAKIRRPSTMPSASTSRSFSSRMTSAASLATSVAESTEMPTSAACRASASFTPSPRKATPTAGLPLDADDPGLVLGADPREHRRRRDHRRELRVVEPVEVGAGQRTADRPGRGPGRPSTATAAIVPGDDLDGDPEAGQSLQGLGRIAAWAGRGTPAGRPAAGRARHRRSAWRARPPAGWRRRPPGCRRRTPRRARLAHAAGTPAQRSRTVSGAPLVTSVALTRGHRSRGRTPCAARGRTGSTASRV